jgi:hypothetical protein
MVRKLLLLSSFFFVSHLFGVLKIPKLEDITTEAELRYRGTYFGDFGLFEKHRKDTDPTTWEHEFRGDLILKKGRHLLEFRLGHIIQEENDLLFPPDDTIEQIHQAYLDFSLPAYDELNVRVGRQELSYGQGILVDSNDWDMEGFYFDALKVYWNGSTWDIDVLYGQMADEHDNELAGINFKRTSEQHTINEFYLWYFGLEEGQDRIPLTGSQGVEAFNLGTRMEGKLSQSLFYHWMFNYQFGEFHSGGVTNDLDSYNFLINLDYFVDHKVLRNVGIEFTVSSGNDADSADIETFIPAYGNKHTRSGGMDWMSMMNSEILTLYLFADLHPKLHGLVEYHHFSMNSLDAGWYLADLGAGWFDDGTLQKWPTPGAEANAISKEVGQELDLHLLVGNNPNRSLSFGYSVFFPGSLLKSWDWLKDDTVNWGYVQTELKF